MKGDVSRKKCVCVPTLTKIFRPVTRNTLIFFIWPKLGSQDLINDIWIDGHIEAFYFLFYYLDGLKFRGQQTNNWV